MSKWSSGMILGPPSMGSPLPSKTRPNISADTGSLSVSPRNRTDVADVSKPEVPSKT